MWYYMDLLFISLFIDVLSTAKVLTLEWKDENVWDEVLPFKVIFGKICAYNLSRKSRFFTETLYLGFKK
jgi:hypothetical protein